MGVSASRWRLTSTNLRPPTIGGEPIGGQPGPPTHARRRAGARVGCAHAWPSGTRRVSTPRGVGPCPLSRQRIERRTAAYRPFPPPLYGRPCVGEGSIRVLSGPPEHSASQGSVACWCGAAVLRTRPPVLTTLGRAPRTRHC